jgi:hypothetical protein
MMFEKTWDEDYGNGLVYADELSNGDFFLVGWRILTRIGNTPDAPQEYACRMTANGTILWEKDWGNPGEPEGVSKVIKCHDGTYMLAGTGLSGAGGGIDDITACNITADGTILFYHFYNFGYSDGSSDIIETVDSCFIICGTASTSPSQGTTALLKIDRYGNEIWRHWQTTLGGVPGHIQQTPDNGFIIAGANASHNNSYYAKYKPDGTMDWVKYPFGLSDTIPNVSLGLRAFKNGDFDIYYYTSYQLSDGSTANALLKQYDSSGNNVSTKIYTYPLGKMYLNSTDSTFWAIDLLSTVILRSDDNNEFSKVVELNAEDAQTKSIYNCITTSDGGYLGVGCYYTDALFTQFYITKFGQDGRYAADQFSESVNAYPNPSTDGNVTLTFDMTKDDNVQVDIYTTDGKLIYSNSIFCPANSHTELPLQLDAISTNGGMYILQARTADAVIRKKLVVMRR